MLLVHVRWSGRTRRRRSSAFILSFHRRTRRGPENLITQNLFISRLSPRQFTRDEAIGFAATERWRFLSLEESALFQLRQDCPCIPFSRFQEGMNRLLGRSVFTHEFADPDALWAEYLGSAPMPSTAAILDRLERSLVPDQGKE